MILLGQASALVAVVGVGVIFGTDAFCALVLRPALARTDDAALTTVMGNVHRYGDRRMPVPGVLGLVGGASAAASAVFAGRPEAAISSGAAVTLLIVWLVVYARISAPINRVLTSAVDREEIPDDARALQAAWDRVIVLRATLQGLALLSMSTTLLLL